MTAAEGTCHTSERLHVEDSSEKKYHCLSKQIQYWMLLFEMSIPAECYCTILVAMFGQIFCRWHMADKKKAWGRGKGARGARQGALGLY